MLFHETIKGLTIPIMFQFINKIPYRELFFTVHLNQMYSGYTFWQSNRCSCLLVTA